MLKIDLHTHSEGSIDGSINLDDYKFILDSKKLDIVAITDHDTIEFAEKAQQELGKARIIIGEEISTLDGEIIGLYLNKRVAPNQTAKSTAAEIKSQGGIVLVPHPFETVRKGITIETLNSISGFVDIIEVPNGRSLQSHDDKAVSWAKQEGKVTCGNSDAHRVYAIGKTYTVIAEQPNSTNLITLLKSAKTVYRKPSLLDLLAPKYNRYVKRTGKH